MILTILALFAHSAIEGRKSKVSELKGDIEMVESCRLELLPARWLLPAFAVAIFFFFFFFASLSEYL